MINKVTQTRCSSMYFFPTNAVYSLKSFISATSNANFYFFLPLPGFGEEDPKGASCQDDQQQFFNVFNQDDGFFLDSLVRPRNT